MPQVIEYPDEFRARHGNDYAIIEKGRRFLFADGALCDPFFQDRVEPPTDPTTLLEARRLFHDTKASQAEDAFRKLKNALLGEGATYTWNVALFGQPPAGGDGKDALRRLKEIAAPHREAVAKIDAELAELPEARRKRAREEEKRQWETEQRIRVNDERVAIEAIEL